MADNARVTVNSNELRYAIDRVSRLADDASDAYESIGNKFINRVKRQFRGSVDPYGKPWAPLKRRAGQPLRDTGRLMRSFTYLVANNQMYFGTNVVYGKYHQEGTRYTPARKFLPDKGVPAKWRRDIEQSFARALKNAINK